MLCSLALTATATVAMLHGPTLASGSIVVDDHLAADMELAEGDTVRVRLPGATGDGVALVVKGTYPPPPDPAEALTDIFAGNLY